MPKLATYALQDPSKLITPCLLVYPTIIQRNLEASLRIAGSVERLRPHVKTHKTPEIVRMQLEMGITKHKCATLCEAQMLAEQGVADVLIAYPQIGPAIARFVRVVQEFPNTNFATLVDNLQAAQALEACLANSGRQADVLVDIDNGMHRTGIPAGAGAKAIYEFLHQSTSIRAAGLHVYDGQNHQPSLQERKDSVARLMQPVIALVQELEDAGMEVPKLVCGGTPTFGVFADFDLPGLKSKIECSPGTCVLSDFNYGRDYPDLEGIEHAAVVMTRVISKQPGSGQFTCDLGNKAIAADPPAGRRCHLLGLTDAVEVKQNEEHLMVRCQGADDFQVGDVLYAIPAHICPTSALHRHMHVIREGQHIDTWEVTARDRIYS
ncbi:MAG: D-TA family PLP-dependent enzyme [Planctomycetota bacterium]